MASKMEKLAYDIKKVLVKHKAWMSVAIYFDGKCLTCYGEEEKVEKRDVKKMVEYCNPDTITMTFEGPLYHAFNYNKNPKLVKELEKLFEKNGLYHEFGHAWSLALYK